MLHFYVAHPHHCGYSAAAIAVLYNWEGSNTVALVRVKEKFQITLPGKVRKQAKLAVGDYLEAKVDGQAIQLTRRSAIDRKIAQGLADLRAGRTYGPYHSAKEMERDFDLRHFPKVPRRRS